MLGPLFRTAATMATYGISSVMTRRFATLATHEAKTLAKRYVSFAASSTNEFLKQAGKNLDYAFNLTGSQSVSVTKQQLATYQGRHILTDKIVQGSRVQRFMSDIQRGVWGGVTDRFLPHQVRMIHKAKRQLGMEATFLPANYILYRYERHRAVTPEQRDDTSSFTKWYLSGAFFPSIVSGIALDKITRGTGKRIGFSFAKRMQPLLRDRMLKSVTNPESMRTPIGAAKKVVEWSMAGAMARRELTQGRGVLSALASGVRPRDLMSNFAVITKKIYNQQFGANRLTTSKLFEQDMQELVRVMEHEFLRKKGVKKSDFVSVTKSMLKDHVDKYNAEFKPRGVTSWNKFLRYLDYGTGEKKYTAQYRAEHATRQLSLKINDEDVSYMLKEDPAIFNINGKRTDFGGLSVHKTKNFVIQSLTRSVPGFVVDLFSLKDSLIAKTSEYSLRSQARSPVYGSIYLPRGYEADNSIDAVRKVFGLPDTPEGIRAAREFAETRAGLYSGRGFIKRFGETKARKILGSPVKSQSLSDQLLTTSIRHGEIPIGSNDIVEHLADGSMYITTVTKKKTKRKLNRYHVGAMENGDFLAFSRLTSSSNDIVTKIQRSFLSNKEVTTAYKGEQFSITAGPVMSGAIVESPEETLYDIGMFGTLRRLKKRLEIGESEERGIFSSLRSIFTKFDDARYIPSFLSEDGIRNPLFISSIVSNRRSMNDFLTLLKDETKDAALYTYMRLSSDKSTRSILENITQHVPSVKLIHGSQTAEAASKTIDEFLKTLGDNTLFSAFKEEISDLQHVSASLKSNPSESVYSIIGERPGGAARWLKGTRVNPSLIDSTNATMLMIQGSFDEGKVFSYLASHVPQDSIEHASATAMTKFPEMYTSFHKLIKESLDSTSMDVFRATKTAVTEQFDIYLDRKKGVVPTLLRYYERRSPLSAMLPFSRDVRNKVEPPSYNEIFAIAKQKLGDYRGFISHAITKEGEHIPVGVLDTPNILTMTLLRAFNKASTELLDIGINESKAGTPAIFVKKLMTKRILPTLGGLIGYSVADRLADKYLEGTPFGEGLTTFGLNIYAGLKVASFNMLEATGIRSMSSYLEDVMPGVISSPLSGAVRGLGPIAAGTMIGFKSLGPHGGLMGGLIGGGIGMLLGGLPLGIFGDWDISKSRDTIIQELQGKELVPIRKGRFWELSRSPFEGTKVQYYRPHLYSLLRSKYKQSPELKDSIFADVIGAIAPDYYAVKDYYSRPYPVTAGLLGGIPLIGSLIRSVPFLGTMLGGGFPLHEDARSPLYVNSIMKDGKAADILAPPTIDGIASDFNSGTGLFDYVSPNGGFTFGADFPNITERPMTTSMAEFGIGETISQFQDIVGLRGFLMGSLYEEMTGQKTIADFAPLIVDPSEVSTLQRSYWDYEFGGLLGTSEVIRRYIPHKRNEIQMFNPIRNTMPDYLPGTEYHHDFLHGDPYTRVPLGEARLPGVGYEKLHDVDLAFPMVAEVIGDEINSQVDFYLGHPAALARRNRDMEVAKVVVEDMKRDAERIGDMIRANVTLYNPELDLSAQADLMVKNQEGLSIPIKVVPKGYSGVSALNAFLVLNDSDYGVLVEVDPENHSTMEQRINKDVRLFERDVANARKAQSVAASTLQRMNRQRTPHNLANAYSWITRYSILADVAPFSEKTRKARAIVQQQIENNLLSSEQLGEISMIDDRLESVKEPIDTDEYRFLNIGSHVTKEAQMLDNFYATEYNVVERTVGAIWEKATHIRSPLTTKFINTRSALEEYEAQFAHGKQMSLWENPVEDFLKTYISNIQNEDDALQGALSMATTGVVLSAIPGVMGGVMPLAALSTAGAAIGAYNSMFGSKEPRESIQEVRQVRQQYDAHIYVRNLMLYNKTGDPQYLKEAQKTMTSSGLTDVLPNEFTMRSYFGSTEYELLDRLTQNMTYDQVSNVANIIPEEYLQVYFSKLKNPSQTGTYNELYNVYRPEQTSLAPLESPIYREDIKPESIAIATMEDRGLNSHDVGLGWYAQLSQLERERQRGADISRSTLLPDKENDITLGKYLSDPTTLQPSITSKIKSYIDVPSILARVVVPLGGMITRIDDDGMNFINVEITII